MLRMFRKAMLGTETTAYLEGFKELSPIRVVGLGLLVSLVLLLGLFPSVISELSDDALRNLLLAY
jgi:NADH:ubiquinone oxidoreductase subunit 4 (subunit M)